ncbi:MAG: hypothetical protein QOD39_1846 [Mycobacterium sp.]|nr:hypothetical protein [Mycobacterium sp.]
MAESGRLVDPKRNGPNTNRRARYSRCITSPPTRGRLGLSLANPTLSAEHSAMTPFEVGTSCMFMCTAAQTSLGRR